MTLLLSANLRNVGVVHVSDRRLTQRFPGEVRQFDYANKQLLIRCEDAVVIAAFTGVARVCGEPTDDWIARALLQTDQRLTYNFGGPTLPLLNFSDIHYRLSTALQQRRVLRQLRDPRSSLAIAMVGLRRAGRTTLPEPFWAAFRVQRGRFAAMVSPKYQYFRQRGTQFVFAGSGDALAQRFVDAGVATPAMQQITDLEDYLVTVNRAVATADPGVGPDAMVTSFNFDRALEYDASIRFVQRPGAAVVRDVYTPWLLGPGFTMPPSATISGGSVVGPTSFRVKIPASPSGTGSSPVVLSVAPAPRPGPTLPPPSAVFPVTSEAIIESIRREHMRRLFAKRNTSGSSDAGRQTSIGDLAPGA